MQYRCLFIWLVDHKALFVCIKDRTCLRMAITAYHFNIFGSIFGALFCSLIKKLILGFKSEVWVHFLGWTKKKYFFPAHWHDLNFLGNYLLIRPENLKTWTFLKIWGQTFLREKVSTFDVSKWYMYTFWLLITLCNMSKGLVT